MKGKILFAAGLATGYVLGSKAGRQAYERIKSQASDIWESPAVQKTVSQAGTLAKETASTAQSKVSSALGHATEAVSSGSATSGSATSGSTTSGSATSGSASSGSGSSESSASTKESPADDTTGSNTTGSDTTGGYV